MNSEKTIEIAVRTVFAGGRSAQQAFIDLIRASTQKARNSLEFMPNQVYTESVVFPGVHAPERGICHE